MDVVAWRYIYVYINDTGPIIWDRTKFWFWILIVFSNKFCFTVYHIQVRAYIQLSETFESINTSWHTFNLIMKKANLCVNFSKAVIHFNKKKLALWFYRFHLNHKNAFSDKKIAYLFRYPQLCLKRKINSTFLLTRVVTINPTEVKIKLSCSQHVPPTLLLGQRTVSKKKLSKNYIYTHR